MVQLFEKTEETDVSAPLQSPALIPPERIVSDGGSCCIELADLRLKAMRDAEQIIEYLNILATRRHLNREQLQAMVAQHLTLHAAVAPVNPTADADHFIAPKDWQLAALRRALVELIMNPN